MPRTGDARIKPVIHEIEVHSSGEKLRLLTFIDLNVRSSNLNLCMKVLIYIYQIKLHFVFKKAMRIDLMLNNYPSYLILHYLQSYSRIF